MSIIWKLIFEQFSNNFRAHFRVMFRFSFFASSFFETERMCQTCNVIFCMTRDLLMTLINRFVYIIFFSSIIANQDFFSSSFLFNISLLKSLLMMMMIIWFDMIWMWYKNKWWFEKMNLMKKLTMIVSHFDHSKFQIDKYDDNDNEINYFIYLLCDVFRR
jgi:hypothetical protein